MTQYEALVDHAESRGIQVIEFDFTSELKGLCIGNYIGIKKDLPDDEKLVTLYEELAHAQTSFGNILDQRNPNNRKQEQIARRRAHDEFQNRLRRRLHGFGYWLSTTLRSRAIGVCEPTVGSPISTSSSLSFGIRMSTREPNLMNPQTLFCSTGLPTFM